MRLQPLTWEINSFEIEAGSTANPPPESYLRRLAERHLNLRAPILPSASPPKCSLNRIDSRTAGSYKFSTIVAPRNCATMLFSARSRLPASLSTATATSRFLLARPLSSSSSHRHPENFVQANDPRPKDPPANVSGTNAVPVDAVGARDAPLVEAPEEGERQRQLQAPNRKERWSRSQQARDKAMTGPRFEQTIMEYQVS